MTCLSWLDVGLDHRIPEPVCVCVYACACVLATAHTIYTQHVCAQTCTHYSTYVCKISWAHLCMHVQCYNMYNSHMACMHRHVTTKYIHRHLACLCMPVQVSSMYHGHTTHAHVCTPPHSCVHTRGCACAHVSTPAK